MLVSSFANTLNVPNPPRTRLMHSRRPKQLTVGLSVFLVEEKDSGSNAVEKEKAVTTDPVRKWQDALGVSLSKVRCRSVRVYGVWCPLQS